MGRVSAQAARRNSFSIVGASAAAFALFQWFFVLHTDVLHFIEFFRLRGLVKDIAVLSQECTDSRSTLMVQAAQLRPWVMITIAGGALAGAISAWSLLAIVNLWTTGDAQNRRKRIVSIVWRFLVFSAILFLISPADTQPDLRCFSPYIRVCGTGGALFLAIGFVMAAIWAAEMRIEVSDRDATTVKMLLDYIKLRGCMQSLFALASILLVSGMIHFSIRQAMEAALSGPSGSVTAHGEIFLEGLGYTILLACAYIPIHARFNKVGDELLDKISTKPESANPETIVQWASNRKSLEDLMNLRSYEWKSFGPGLAVIAPVLVGFISKIVEALFSGSR